MPDYRIDRMNSSGLVVSGSDASYASDEEALTQAKIMLMEGGQADVWAGTRFVCRVTVPSALEIQASDRAARRDAEYALALLAEGVRPVDVAKELGIGEAGLYRVVAAK